jgi:hypothetical protein
MKMIVLVSVLSLAAFACKKKGGGGDCDKAIAHGLELAKADLPSDEKMLAKMKDLGIQHCKDDKWPDDAIKCMVDAKAETEAQACYGKLSPEQQKKMNDAAAALQPTPPPKEPAAGSAAAGSDSGSAAGSPHAGSGM